MRDGFCVALDAARRPLAPEGATLDGAERLEQLKVQPMRGWANCELGCFRGMITELRRPPVPEQATALQASTAHKLSGRR